MKRSAIWRRGARIAPREAALLLLLLAVTIVAYIAWKWSGGGSMEKGSDQNGKHWESSPLWAEDNRPQLNPHKFRYILNEPEYCGVGEVVNLLILVASAVRHRDNRDAIRATWGASEHLRKYNAKVVFLLGQGEESQTEVMEESKMHNDIVQEDFKDTYRNLTLKTVMGLKWSAIFCPQAKHVMKTDDDIFVNVPLLHGADLGQERITGCIKNGQGRHLSLYCCSPSFRER